MNYIIGLFIPVYHRTNEVENCLEALIQTLVDSEDLHLILTVCVGINAADKRLRDFISLFKEKIKARRIECNVYDPGKNIGKPAIVNYMVRQMSNLHKLDFVVSFDSDMVIQKDTWLLDFVRAYFGYREKKPLGALAANQCGMNCHAIEGKHPIKINSIGYTLISTDHNGGIAGGVLFTPYTVWNTLKGYRAFTIYASDDAHYMADCDSRGYSVAIVEEIMMLHPQESVPDYAKWKQRAALRTLGPHEEKGFFESKVDNDI